MLVEPLEEPDERIDERYPQQDLHPCVRDEFRERARRSDDNEVVCRREGGKLDFERAIVRGLFDDQGFDGLLEGAKIPAVYTLWGGEVNTIGRFTPSLAYLGVYKLFE